MKKGESTKVCHCGAMSLPGFKKGFAMCQFHWSEGNYGTDWALYVTGQAICSICKESVTPQTGVYHGTAYCQPCYTKEKAL